ncbi:MAG: GNAT family N-acetyltransferase [Caldilineaceae bacterium]|nr:GNAT family N-acetyltransferase [Caldilineaceae bacterium]
MQIDFLTNHPQFIPALAAWHHAMWGELDPEATLQSRIARLKSHTGQPAIPTTVVAFEDGTLLGSASLVKNDLRTHPHLTPFLASVYVGESFRRRGIASALVERVMAEAKGLGVATLYLITPDQQRLYQRLGWQAQEVVPYRGEDVTLMATDLT